MRNALISGLMMLGLCAGASAEGLLNNPGFEQKDFAGWTVRGQGWTLDKNSFSEGKLSALCTVKEGSTPEIRACTQTFTGVKQDQIIEVSMQVSGVNVYTTASSKACLAVLCVDAAGNVLKEYRASVIKPTAAFQEIKIDDAIVLPRTDQIYVMVVVEVYRKAPDDDWWRFDDVNLKIH